MKNFRTTFLINTTNFPLNVSVTRVLVAKLDFRLSLYLQSTELKLSGLACLLASLVSESNARIFILCFVRY